MDFEFADLKSISKNLFSWEIDLQNGSFSKVSSPRYQYHNIKKLKKECTLNTIPKSSPFWYHNTQRLKRGPIIWIIIGVKCRVPIEWNIQQQDDEIVIHTRI